MKQAAVRQSLDFFKNETVDIIRQLTNGKKSGASIVSRWLVGSLLRTTSLFVFFMSSVTVQQANER